MVCVLHYRTSLCTQYNTHVLHIQRAAHSNVFLRDRFSLLGMHLNFTLEVTLANRSLHSGMQKTKHVCYEKKTSLFYSPQ